MATVNPVGNIAPFINKQFVVSSEWWIYRDGVLHRGLDISTGANDILYSMLTGHVLDKGNTTTAGNYIIIVDDILGSQTYGYATRYLHMRDSAVLPVGAAVQVGQAVGTEGATGQGVTGIHLHLEMQDVSRFNWEWHFSDTQSDYINPCLFMGIENQQGTHWIYDGTPHPVISEYDSHFPFVLYARKLRGEDEEQVNYDE